MEVAPLLSTCRRFHQILTPLLHRTVNLISTSRGENRLGLFFRTTRDNDTLALYVRHLQLWNFESTTKFEDTAESVNGSLKKGEEWLSNALPRMEV